MSTAEEERAAISAPPTTNEEAVLFSTVNDLLVVLGDRLKDRPHGQFTLFQLPDIFLIKAQLDQLLELKTKETKYQETLVQMAMDREEEGVKGAKKRVKNTGTQATAIRQAVAEEVANRTADSQRHIANLEDRLRKAEKVIEAANNKTDRLGDKVGVLKSDFNKVSKASREDEYQSVQSLIEPLEARIKKAEDKFTKVDSKTRAIANCVTEEHERVMTLCKNDKINDCRHEILQDRIKDIHARVDVLGRTNDYRHTQCSKKQKIQTERLDDQEEALEVVEKNVKDTGDKLMDVVNVVDSNASALNNILGTLFKHTRFLQSRLQITMMPLWNHSMKRIERSKFEDEVWGALDDSIRTGKSQEFRPGRG